jgi:hypothetical protein
MQGLEKKKGRHQLKLEGANARPIGAGSRCVDQVQVSTKWVNKIKRVTSARGKVQEIVELAVNP